MSTGLQSHFHSYLSTTSRRCSTWQRPAYSYTRTK